MSMYLHLPPTGSSAFQLGLLSVGFVLGVVLPFTVMYVLGKKVASESLKPIMVCTFLGCWIGGVAVWAVLVCINYLYSGGYGWHLTLEYTLWTIWKVFSTAFSAIFFVSLVGLLLAHWQKTVDK